MDLMDVLGMPHGADRNFALRRWLGLSSGEVCQVSLGPTVMVVTSSNRRASQVARKLRPELPGDQWWVRTYKRSDGKWVTYAIEPDAPADSFAVEWNRMMPLAAELGVSPEDIPESMSVLRRQL